jgi:hypothetical protein
LLIKLTLLTALFLSVFVSCREYLTDVVDITPPEISTDRPDYNSGDTVVVTLINKSFSDIYVTGTYNKIEKHQSSNWDLYSIVSCNGSCPEFILPGKGSMTARVMPLENTGNFRFLCYYSKKAEVPQVQKDIIYSNEFSVGE